MQRAIAVITLGWLVLLGTSVQAADQPQSGPTPAGHQMPMQAGQTAADPPPGTDPHAGHTMPEGMGMVGGHMHRMMMHCAMPAQMSQVVAALKEIVVVQEALLKGGATDKEVLQAKVVAVRKTLETLQAQAMHCPMMHSMQHSHAGAPASGVPVGSAVSQAFAKDPICGMDVDMAQAQAGGLTLEYQGKTYYFCSDQCKEQFAKNPRP